MRALNLPVDSFFVILTGGFGFAFLAIDPSRTPSRKDLGE